MKSEAILLRYEKLTEQFAGQPNVTVGYEGKRGFGSTALQVNGKIFAMLVSSGKLVVKLSTKRVAELEESGLGERFHMGNGRVMKEWFADGTEADDQWYSLATEALNYVRGSASRVEKNR